MCKAACKALRGQGEWSRHCKGDRCREISAEGRGHVQPEELRHLQEEVRFDLNLEG